MSCLGKTKSEGKNRYIILHLFKVKFSLEGKDEVRCYFKTTLSSFENTFSWIANPNERNTISFSVGKISFIYLMTPIDFTNDQNAMRRVI